MSLILIQIPNGTSGHLQGEAQVEGYDDLMLADSFSFSIQIESVMAETGRRTVEMPQISVFTIERQVDTATFDLMRQMMTGHMTAQPWTVYFLRGGPAGGKTGKTGKGSAKGRPQAAGGEMQAPYLVIRLHKPLILSHDVSADDDGMKETLEISAAKVEWNYTVLGPENQSRGKMSWMFDQQVGWVS